jgi:replicative DNA helicase
VNLDSEEISRNRPTAKPSERAILGAMMLDEVSLEIAVDSLIEADFALDSHRRIFRSIYSLFRSGTIPDELTVAADLRRHRELDSVGGPGYLATLSEGLPRKIRIENYIKEVKEKAALRDLINIASSTLDEATDQGEDSADIVERAMQRMQEVIEGREDSKMERMGDFINLRYRESESVFDVTRQDTGIPSGWPQYDALTNGFHRGELSVVAARPSMGKTAWVGSLLDNVARVQQRKTGVFILEQAKQSLMSRMLCGRAMASLDRFAKGQSTPTERTYIADALDEFRKAPLYWDDRSQMTVTKIRAKVQRMIRDGEWRKLPNGMLVPDVDLIVIDQLSHIGMGDMDKKMQRDEKKGEIALRLKKLAKELNVPVVLMAQINRAALKNKDSIPTLADLADSGYLEQHADNVTFLHRPEYYDRSDDSLRGKGQMIVAKQRDGATGTCHVTYIADCCRWRDEHKASATSQSLDDYMIPSTY